MKKQRLICLVLKNKLFRSIYYFIKRNKINKSIKIESTARLIKCSFCQDKKNTNNYIYIGNGSSVINTTFIFHGNNNIITIGDNARIIGNSYIIYDDNNIIKIGNNFNSGNSTKIISLEGGKIEIGDNCLFSYDVEIRNSDSHSILDSNGYRINFGKNIFIDHHVWIAQRVLVLKGATIKNDTIIGANSLLTSHIYESKTLYVGIPAKEIKKDVVWDIERI